MPDPSALPAETIYNILHQLDEDRLGSLRLHQDYPTEYIQSLHACCLLSRSWYAQANSLLYWKFRHISKENSWTQFWRFLRTVLFENPELGKLVRHLDLRDRPTWTDGRKQKISIEEKRSRRRQCRSLLALGASLRLNKLPRALDSQSRGPFMLILLDSLPNISKLDLSLHLKGDQVDQALPIFKLSERVQPLQHLEHFTCFDSTAVNLHHNIFLKSL